MTRRLFVASLVLACALVGLALPAGASAAFGPIAVFGSSGAGPGQLENTGSLGVAPDGSIYVADYGNNRVSVFGPVGDFQFAFGKEVDPSGGDICTTSTGCQAAEASGAAGAMEEPESLAFDSEGNVYVADQNNERIDVFKPDGAFLFAFGKEVDPSGGDVCTSACQSGVASEAAGGLERPDGIAVSGSTVYVADTANDRIAVFSMDGTFRYAFGAEVNSNGSDLCSAGESCKEGLEGSEAGEIGEPYDVKVAPSGLLFVTEEENDRVGVFTAEGAFVRAMGKAVNKVTAGDVCTVVSGCETGASDGTAGSMSEPSALSVDSAENVYVADTALNRIDEWTADGTFVKAWGAGVQDGAASFQVCTAETGCQTGREESFAGAVPKPYGVAADCKGGIWTAEAPSLSGAVYRVQRFGEPGTPNPPCPAPLAPVTGTGTTGSPTTHTAPAQVVPSNAFKFGKLKLNKKKGTATLTVKVPGPGKLVLAGKGLKKATKAAKRAGSVVLPVKPVGKAKEKLAEVGKVRLKAKVTFTPTGGKAATKTKSLTLKQTLRQIS